MAAPPTRSRLSQTSDAFTSPLLDLLFEEDRIGRCLVAPDGTVVRANAEWLRSTGFVEDRVLGENVTELFPATRDMALAMHARVRAGHRVVVPRHAQTLNGRETWWEGSIDPVPMEGGTGLLISAREVSGPLADHRRLEDALRHDAELLDLCGALLELDREFRVVTVNAAQERISRTPRTVSVGRVFWEIWPEVKGTRYVEEYRRCMQQRVTVEFEDYYAPLDLWTNVTAYPTSGGGLVAFFRDVTAQRRAADALAAETEKYRSLFQHSLDAVYLALADGTILDANPAALRLHGMTLEEIRRAGRAGLVVTDDRHAAALRERAATGHTRTELTVRREDGTTVPVEVESVLLDPGRPDSAAFVISRDIAARKQAEEELRANLASTRRAEAEARESERVARARTRELETLFACVADGVAVYDGEGKVIRMNAAGAEIYGRLRAPAGGPGEDLAASGLASRARHYVREDGSPMPVEQAPAVRALRGETVVNEVVGFVRGARDVVWVRVSAAPLSESGEQVGAVVSFADVTAAKQREEALRDANAQLREADRRKTEFLGLLSHELRNPLAPIRNSTFLLERAAPGSVQAERATRVIRRQTDHLTRLVDDLLDVTRISRGKVELKRDRLDLRELVRKTTDDLHDVFDAAGVDLRVEPLGPGPVWVDADPTRVSQVVGNLLQNAAKFTRPGGSATVSLACDGAQAELRVRDTGVGMDPEAVAGMFEPFAQADHSLARTQGGLGLGLALVKGLVELHGGTVHARSDGVGRGAEFVVRLPTGSLPAGGAAAPEAPAAVARSVVVIEDNADAAETLAELLALGGHRVSVAREGRSGIALVREVRPDVVLCDVGLPDVDGYEVARALRADPSLRATRLVALSGYAQPEDRRRAYEAGFDEHLAKPPDPEALEAALRGEGHA